MTTKSDGGPSGYYDFPKAETLNDALEYLGEDRWKGDSFHLANIVKATWRWGTKEGTTIEYDLRKIIYSACRLLMKYTSVQEVRVVLYDLLDDPQFKPKAGDKNYAEKTNDGDWIVVHSSPTSTGSTE